jgi:menaquinone-dependent protoporphyrinogen oxidase
MTTVTVVYASRHGATEGIARRIAEVLRTEGAEVVVADAADHPDPASADACVIGSGVYMGRWLREGIEFLDTNEETLSTKPVWMFSSGPLPGSPQTPSDPDALTAALGPQEGPGSGGRREIARLSGAIHPRDHHVFLGAFDPASAPKSMLERLVRLMPAAKRVLPAGDYRDWAAIEAWARAIAADL